MAAEPNRMQDSAAARDERPSVACHGETRLARPSTLQTALHRRVPLGAGELRVRPDVLDGLPDVAS